MKLLLASMLEKFSPKLENVFGSNLSNMDVVCIPTAAYGEENHEWLEAEQLPLKNAAKSFLEIDIAGKTKEEISEVMKDADIIYVTGGNTYYLLEQVKKSGFADVLTECLSNGATYVGCSAGAIIACPRIDFIADMDDPSKADLEDFTAMNLVDFLVIPHVDHETYGPQATKIIEEMKSKNEKVIGLKDEQALYADGNYMEIY